MDAKNMRNLGIVGSAVGMIILLFGISKYNYAKSMYKASSWFGETDSSNIWNGYMSNYKIFIIVGAIILVIFAILAITGIINLRNRDDNSIGLAENNITTSQKLSELKQMMNDGLITKEEFDTKKKEIMDRM